eukprot:733357-Hanusia_phi.AAC.1
MREGGGEERRGEQKVPISRLRLRSNREMLYEGNSGGEGDDQLRANKRGIDLPMLFVEGSMSNRALKNKEKSEKGRRGEGRGRRGGETRTCLLTTIASLTRCLPTAHARKETRSEKRQDKTRQDKTIRYSYQAKPLAHHDKVHVQDSRQPTR